MDEDKIEHQTTFKPVPYEVDNIHSTIESVTLMWKDSEIVAMARKNGEVRLYKVENMTYTDFNDLMGAHTPKV